MSLSISATVGSSPRMRGARRRHRRHQPRAGIIPAYAGSTRPSSTFAAGCRDHPRVCGEHYFVRTATQQPGGSSPRMRGAPAHEGLPAIAQGIIPAYAGSTISSSRNMAGYSGSSPRMRGAHLAVVDAAAVGGIIPAYAGSTTTSCCCSLRRRDHPRVCGEHRGRVDGRRVCPGSSPRMRGALLTRELYDFLRGIIPAYAGSTRGRRI